MARVLAVAAALLALSPANAMWGTLRLDEYSFDKASPRARVYLCA